MSAWNRLTPWRQGHLLNEDAIDALLLRDPTDPELPLVIVATHDCDLAQTPEAEPRVEVIIGRRIADADGNCTHAKNARKLHLEFAGELPFWAEFEATAKVALNKEKLNEFVPHPTAHLLPENRASFQLWLASRYRRSAFADAFEHRLTRETKLAEKISKAVKPHGALIAGVFFDVDEGREITRHDADDPYVLDIILLHAAEPDFLAAERAAQAAANAITAAFRKKCFNPTATWRHIELRACEAVSETVLTYHQFKQLKRWRLEHLSLAADPPQPVLAE